MIKEILDLIDEERDPDHTPLDLDDEDSECIFEYSRSMMDVYQAGLVAGRTELANELFNIVENNT